LFQRFYFEVFSVGTRRREFSSLSVRIQSQENDTVERIEKFPLEYKFKEQQITKGRVDECKARMEEETKGL
jgi:hypothetical protein